MEASVVDKCCNYACEGEWILGRDVKCSDKK
jgi:hypothetical protein